VLHRHVPKRWKPWKMSVADVDGDGRKEIVLGVIKARVFSRARTTASSFSAGMAKKIFDKWLGSSLSKPFSATFTLANVDGDRAVELLSVETLRDGRQVSVLLFLSRFRLRHRLQRGN
jgi:hypothetical protein